MVLCKVTWIDEEYKEHKDRIICRSIDYADTLPLIDEYYGLKNVIDLYMYPMEDLPIQITKETFEKLIHEEGRI